VTYDYFCPRARGRCGGGRRRQRGLQQRTGGRRRAGGGGGAAALLLCCCCCCCCYTHRHTYSVVLVTTPHATTGAARGGGAARRRATQGGAARTPAPHRVSGHWSSAVVASPMSRPTPRPAKTESTPCRRPRRWRRRSDRVAPAGVVTERAMAPLAGAGSRQRGTGKSGGIDDERSRNPPHHTERPPVS